MEENGERGPLRIERSEGGQPLVTSGRVADTFWTRLRGLIGSAPPAPGEGLLLVPCREIHTFWMGFAIDAVYLDAHLVVVGIDHNLKPWRVGRQYRRTRYVLELPAGTARQQAMRVGEPLKLCGYTLLGLP